MTPRFVPAAGLALLATAVLLTVPHPAQAGLIVKGVTYSLTELTTRNALTNDFVLTITGINGPNDTEAGRSGIEAMGFGQPSHFASVTAPTGFAYSQSGLGSNGCVGNSGNFFCFAANTTPPGTPALAANTTLSYKFSITLSSGTFAGYDPDFKIDWVGARNNYSLVSQTLAPTNAPEPAGLALFGTGLLALAAWARRGRN